MYNIFDVDKLSHRTKGRIKKLGEVFTPELYVEDMLTLLYKDNKNIWSDENIIFFEPSCGHGNIVIQIYEKRLEGIYKKSLSLGIKKPAFHAVANAINTIWAVDIDHNNVVHCQSRVLNITLHFLKEKLGIKNEYEILSQERDFAAHLLCSIKWNIYENDTLSALSNNDTAKENAVKTKSSWKWFKKNGHKPIDHELCWIAFFKKCLAKNSTPIVHKRAIHFVNKILIGKANGFEEFEFAKYLFIQARFASNVQKGRNKIPRRQL